jgi:hypothetical protein
MKFGRDISPVCQATPDATDLRLVTPIDTRQLTVAAGVGFDGFDFGSGEPCAAMKLPALVTSNSTATVPNPAHVLSVRDDFEVAGVATNRVAADVVNLHSCGDFTNAALVSSAVCSVLNPSAIDFLFDQAVAFSCVSNERPAFIGLSTDNFAPETDAEGHEYILVARCFDVKSQSTTCQMGG